MQSCSDRPPCHASQLRLITAAATTTDWPSDRGHACRRARARRPWRHTAPHPCCRVAHAEFRYHASPLVCCAHGAAQEAHKEPRTQNETTLRPAQLSGACLSAATTKPKTEPLLNEGIAALNTSLQHLPCPTKPAWANFQSPGLRLQITARTPHAHWLTTTHSQQSAPRNYSAPKPQGIVL